MEKLCMTLEEAHEHYVRENKKHFKRWAHEFEVVKAWLAAGGRVIPKRYDGYGFYLYQDGENIYGRHTWSKGNVKNRVPFCKASNGLMDEGFIIIPNDHVISDNKLCPEWFMRTRQK